MRKAPRWPRVFAATALAAAGFVVFVGVPTAGDVAATERATLAFGRATLVAETGAKAHYQTRWDGSSEVVQERGEIFYRVEPSSLGARHFVVKTPTLDVFVKGTCFRVEVRPMSLKQLGIGAGIGAALGAAVVVSVYEGRVVVKNAHGETAVLAGERVHAAPGKGPEKIVISGAQKALLEAPPEGISREELIHRDRAQREHIGLLQAQLRRQGGVKVAEGGEDLSRGAPRKFFDIGKDELVQMAKRCELRFALPPYGDGDPSFGEKQAAKMGLSEADRSTLNEIVKRRGKDLIGRVRDLYQEVTGDERGAESLGLMPMMHEIEQKSGDGEATMARKRIAEERAGLLAPPASLQGLNPVDRLYRMVVSEGDELEKELAARLNPERGKELREKMSGMRSIMSGCSSDEEDEDE